MAGWLARLQRGYMHAVAGLAASMMAAMVIIMSVQVFYRYFLSDAFIWAEEVCRYLLIWITFLFAGAAFQRGEMVSMELLIGLLPGWARRTIMAPAYLLTGGFAGLIVWYGWKFADGNTQQVMPASQFISQALSGREAQLSIFWIYLAIPVGFSFLALHLFVSSLRLAIGAELPRKEE